MGHAESGAVVEQTNKQPGAPPADVTPIIDSYQPYKEFAQDEKLNKQFYSYMEQLYSYNVPDALLVFGMMKDKAHTLNALEVIFHEGVEFRGWLELGHAYKDIMNADYYRAHYNDVYPIVHRKAIIAQYGLVKYFGRVKGFPNAPEYAYALMSPLIELRDTPAARMIQVLRYNPEITREKLTRNDIETAAQVYEAGGYTYQNRAKIIADAEALMPAQDK
ncbi:MAG: hypothetical protein PHP45_09775 [Elusimicrobiales bacterium]|nr:hypothetical protein [Elusimicrobiales bacterium]